MLAAREGGAEPSPVGLILHVVRTRIVPARVSYFWMARTAPGLS